MRFDPRVADHAQRIAGGAALWIVVDDDVDGHFADSASGVVAPSVSPISLNLRFIAI